MPYMKLGFNEATALKCKGQSLQADLETCEKYGYDYIEIRADCLKDYLKGHALGELAAWFKNHRLKPWAYNTLEFFNLRDTQGTKEIDAEIDFIIEAGNSIGMKMVNTVPSFNAGQIPVGTIKEDAVQSLRRIADKLMPHGISISLEFCGLPGCSISQFGTAYEVIKTADRPNVGITLDIFQFHGMDSHWEDLEKADGKKIFVFHLNDFDDIPIGSFEDHLRLWPGDGCSGYARTFNALKGIGFDGICTVETINPEYYTLSHDENIRVSKEKTLNVLSKSPYQIKPYEEYKL
jgi:2-keto-myo-inositol isomerase